VAFTYIYIDLWRDYRSDDLDTLAKGNEGHLADYFSATEHERNEERKRSMNTAANKRSWCFTTTYSQTDAVDTQQTQLRLDTEHSINDDTGITAEQLRRKVGESNILSPQQQNDLYKVFLRYQHHSKKRPGRCTNFEYEFKAEGSVHNSANSRTIPFALREQCLSANST
jgi:hypothetical protein